MINLSNSKVSIKSMFQTMLRSLMPTSLYFFMMPSIALLPLAKSSELRYTGAHFCMLTCNSRRKSAVGMEPLQS